MFFVKYMGAIHGSFCDMKWKDGILMNRRRGTSEANDKG
jgi:hypothetical protein